MTGPEPKINNIAAIKVVILASKMVVLILYIHYQKQQLIFLPFFFLILSIKTLASTAIPTVKIIPVIPGKVSVASNNVRIPISKNKLNISVILLLIQKFYILLA